MIDRRQGKVILFNDRYAMERIYWHETAEGFYFASEAKALLRILPELREFDAEGVAEYLSVNCTLGTRTLFRGIQRLSAARAGHLKMEIAAAKSYFSPSIWEALPKLSPADYENTLRETFLRIVPRYFESSSTMGVALTGGLDTRMIMACRPPGMRNQTCYTFTGPTGRTLDDRVAARVAAACGLEHRLLRLNPDFFSNFGAQADKTVFVTDGYSGIFGAHEIYFHQQARPLATMRLTGNYGSEILRAITTFKPIGLSSDIYNAGDFAAVKSRFCVGKDGAAEKGHPAHFCRLQGNSLEPLRQSGRRTFPDQFSHALSGQRARGAVLSMSRRSQKILAPDDAPGQGVQPGA